MGVHPHVAQTRMSRFMLQWLIDALQQLAVFPSFNLSQFHQPGLFGIILPTLRRPLGSLLLCSVKPHEWQRLQQPPKAKHNKLTNLSLQGSLERALQGRLLTRQRMHMSWYLLMLLLI